MNVLLRHVRWWSGAREDAGDIRIRRGVVAEMGRGLAVGRRERVLELAGHLVLPGLINCHDHLALDLLPLLGTPPYRNMYEWADDIYHPETPPISHILRVGLRDRLRWGAVRNLIAGATTVMHHDPYSRRWFTARFPVRVPARYGWSHSLGFGEDLAADFQRSSGPYVVHAAEGLDARSAAEVDQLDELGVVGRRTVLGHGVGVTTSQPRMMVEAGCGLVWCPASNLRLYGRTAPIADLKGRIRIGLGTDSTLSGSPHLLDELRAAADTGLATPDELLRMVTTDAADLLQLDAGAGRLAPHAAADLCVMPDTGRSPAETLLHTTPADLALVMVAGTPRLAAPEWATALDEGGPHARIDGRTKWLSVDVAALRARIHKATDGVGVRDNPIWHTVQADGSAGGSA